MMPSPPLDAQAARLNRLYVVALSVVAILSIGGQVLVQFTLRLQQNDATVVNVAGRQRMLSQNIIKTALTLASAENDSVRTTTADRLELLLSQWHSSHLALQSGSTEPSRPNLNSPEIRQLFSELDPIHTAMYEAGHKIVAAHRNINKHDASMTNETIELLLKLDPQFLNQMEKIVAEYDREATMRVTRLQQIELVLLTLTLLVLATEGIFIFRPAVQRLQSAAISLLASQAAQQQAQQRAEQANLEKSRFLANISHDLRTPLHAVRGYAELLQNTLLDSEQQSKLAIIKDATSTLTALADDLLDLARIDAGKLEVKIESIKPQEVIGACMHIVSNLAAEKQLLLQFSPPPALAAVHVMADPLRLRQILLNLLTNAVKFTNDGCVEVQLSLDSAGQSICIVVNDTGIGIAPNDQHRVFEAFQQIEKGGQTRGGAGLGLAICRRLADAMGGSLVLESSLGIGSKFSLKLARSEPPEIQPLQLTQEITACDLVTKLSSRSISVLVVDDDAINRKLLADAISSWGHRPHLFSDGIAALKFSATNAIDVALLDLQMPTMSGRELARRLRAMFNESSIPNFPIWAVSATRMSSAVEDSQLFDEYLLKPLSLAELKSQLENASVQPIAGNVVGLSAKAGVHKNDPSNFDKILQRLQGNRELLRSLIEMFLETWPTNKAAWIRAVHCRNTIEIRKQLHLWRGQVSQFDGAEVLQLLDHWQHCSSEQELFDAIESEKTLFERAMSCFQDELRATLSFCES